MSDLRVELDGTLVGTLRDEWRTFDFHAAREGIERFGLESTALSVDIPLTLAPRRSGRARRQAWFAGLLPEGRMLSRLAAEAGLPVHDTIGLLRRYGRDLAGALQIWDPEAPGEPRTPRLQPLSVHGVANLLRTVQDSPLGNADTHGRTSLGGVQDKIVLTLQDELWHRALDGYPSTHLLKPGSSLLPTLIGDEAYGSLIARHLGLAEHRTWIESFADVDALVIERYDRTQGTPPGRVHQEDLSQVLGVTGDQRYQRIGERVSCARVAQALAARLPDAEESLRWLTRMVTLSVAVGNLDMHTKNLSILHPPGSQPRPAPAYDVVPMAHRAGDGEMALAVAGEYRHAALTCEHLVAEARSWGLGTNDAQGLVTATVESIRDYARTHDAPPPTDPRLPRIITTFCDRLLAGQEVGNVQD